MRGGITSKRLPHASGGEPEEFFWVDERDEMPHASGGCWRYHSCRKPGERTPLTANSKTRPVFANYCLPGTVANAHDDDSDNRFVSNRRTPCRHTMDMQMAERLLEALADPFDIAGHQLFISASIGVATTPATDPDTLLRDADTAMYQAKKSGRNRCAAFHPGLHEQTSRHLRRASELHGALERNELRVFYQPLLSLTSGEVTALEALLRWEHPSEGMLFPEEFITVAEDAGLMPAIGAWVLLEACSQTARWTQDYSGLSISVNVSPHQITEELIVHVQSALAASDLSPSQLVLEVTESAVVAIANVSVLERLREIGIRISVDDFGTGFSSLAQLQELPVDELKIDRAFVQRLAGTEADAAIVTSIIELAHAIGLNAVAEGVETTAQAAAVRSLGCDSGQGYLWSRQVGFKSVPALLQRLKNPEPSDPRHPSLGTPGATPL